MSTWLAFWESVFSVVVRLSVQGTILAACVVFLDLVFRGRPAASWRTVLWALVLARLICPVVPESRWSVFQLIHLAQAEAVPMSIPRPSERVEANARYEEPAWEHHPSAMQSPETRAPSTESLSGREAQKPPVSQAPHVAAPPDVRDVSQAVPAADWSLIRVSAVVWALGTLVLFLRCFVLRRKLGQHLGGCSLVTSGPVVDLINECRAALGVRRTVRLRTVPEGFGPAVMGVVRPTILMPESVIASHTPEQIRYIVLHELAHIRRWDVLMHWLTEGVRAVHWFNPAVWLMTGRMQADWEQACDELVLKAAGAEQKVAYGRVVIGLVEHLQTSRIAPALVGFFGRKRQLKRRIEHIRRFRQAGWRTRLSGVLIVGIMALCGLTNAAGPIAVSAQPPSKEPTARAGAGQDEARLPRPAITRKERERRAEAVFERIRDERFEEAATQFTEELRAVLPADKLEELWKQLSARFGTKFLGGSGARQQRFGDERLFVVTCEWKNGKLSGRLALDEAGEIEGVWLVPHPKSPPPEGFPENGYQFGAIIEVVAQADLSLTAQVIGLDGKPTPTSSVHFWKALLDGVEANAWDWYDPATDTTWRQFDGATGGNPMTETHLAPGTYRVTARQRYNQPTPIGVSDPIRLDGTEKNTTVRVPMMPGPTLTLRPVDAATGDPIPRPSVTLNRTDGRFPQYFRFYPARQQDDHELKIPHLPPGTYSLKGSRSASHPDDIKYSLVDAPVTVQVEPGRDHELTLPFEASPLTEEEIAQRWPWAVTGRVTDADGRPVAGATVVAYAGWGTLRRTGTIQTDENGRYTLRFGPGILWVGDSDEEPLNLQAASISCRKPGYVEKSLNQQGGLHATMRKPPADNDWNIDPAQVIVPGQPHPLDFVLVPAAELEVHLVDAAGNPMPDRKVWINGDELPPASNVLRSGKTDAQGVVNFDQIPPEYAWWFVTRIGDSREEVRSLPIAIPRASHYRVTLRQRRHPATELELLEIVALTEADGNDARAELLRDDYRAGPPVSEERQAQGREILEKMREVNRYWLRQPPEAVNEYRYDFQFTGEEPKTYRVPADRRVPGVVLHGISYVSVLDSMTQDVDNVMFRLVDVGPETIRLGYTLREPVRVSCGNGVLGTWKGFFSKSVREGLLTIDARTLTLRKHESDGLQEVLSDYVVVREGRYAPLTVQVKQRGHAYHFQFRLYKPGLWLFSESRRPDGGEPVARIANVFINGRPAQAAE